MDAVRSTLAEVQAERDILEHQLETLRRQEQDRQYEVIGLRKSLILLSAYFLEQRGIDVRSPSQQAIPLRGDSMYPFLKNGDEALVERDADICDIPVGAVVAFKTDRLIVHRVIERHGCSLSTKGDTNAYLDPWVTEGNFIGLIIGIQRN